MPQVKEKPFNIVKNRSRLIFTRTSDDSVIEYDLGEQGFFKKNRYGKEVQVKSVAEMFRGYDERQVLNCFEDEKYQNFINYVAKHEYRCSNMSTILKRLPKYAHIESYYAIGLKIGTYRRYGSYCRVLPSLLTVPVNAYDKSVLRMVREKDIEITEDFERMMVTKAGIEKQIVMQLFLENSPYFRDAFNVLILKKGDTRFGYNSYHIKELISEYNYNYKKLVDYIDYLDRYEALRPSSALTEIRDYARMSSIINGGRGFNRYPKYLKTMHDIIARNYRVHKEKYDEEMFRKVVNSYKDLEYNNKDYLIITPNKAQDMKDEGARLHHCVASYVNSVIKGNSKILFMRKDKDINLITIEVREDRVTQCKGSCNRAPDKEEKAFIKEWADKKQLITVY